MRSFVALEIPAEPRRAAAEVTRELKAAGADVKWVAPDSLHLTLKFLGEISPEQVPPLTRALGRMLEGRGAMSLSLQGCGAFPTLKRPQVVWLGLAGEVAALVELAAGVEEALAPLGFAPERRRFKPHLTIGRLRRRRGKSRPSGPLTRAIAGLAAWSGPDFAADRVALMRSTLTPKGAIYDPVQVFTLLPPD